MYFTPLLKFSPCKNIGSFLLYWSWGMMSAIISQKYIWEWSGVEALGVRLCCPEKGEFSARDKSPVRCLLLGGVDVNVKVMAWGGHPAQQTWGQCWPQSLSLVPSSSLLRQVTWEWFWICLISTFCRFWFTFLHSFEVCWARSKAGVSRLVQKLLLVVINLARNPFDIADFVGLGRIYLSQTVLRLPLLMWEGCETLSTAPPVPQVKPHLCLFCPQNLSVQKNKECSQHLYEVPIPSVGFSFLWANPLTLKPQLKPSLTFPSESARHRPCEVGHMEQI